MEVQSIIEETLAQGTLIKSPEYFAACEILNAAIKRLKGDDPDPGAHFEAEVIAAAQTILAESEGEFARYRAKIKKAGGSNAQIAQWSKLVRGSEETVIDESIADELIELASRVCELFHDPDRKPFATIDQGSHQETWPVFSKGFGEWLSSRYYFDTKRAPSDHALKVALNTLSGAAKFEGEEREVFIRCAPYQDGYMIDLANDLWQAIEILPSGWRIVDRPQVRFWRSDSMRPMPTPTAGGTVDELWQHINIAETDRLLVLTWILECWRPDTPFTILEIIGEQGSAKSTTHDHLRQIIDPNKTNLRSAPRNVEDVQVSAVNSWLASFNNLSRLSPDMQDALCCLSTGGGFSKRALYTDSDEFSENIKRPVAFNGISPLATAPDLVDRTITVHLPRIEAYLEEHQVRKAFESVKSRIFGSLLDLFSASLARLPSIVLSNPPRMADFTKLGESVAVVTNSLSSFSEIYRGKRRASVMILIDSTPIAGALIRFMEDRGNRPIDSTVGGLFAEVTEKRVNDGEAWPKSSRGFANALRRLSPALRTLGYCVQFDPVRRIDGIHVQIEYVSVSGEKVLSNNIHDVHNIQDDEHHEHDECESERVSNPKQTISGVPEDRERLVI